MPPQVLRSCLGGSLGKSSGAGNCERCAAPRRAAQCAPMSSQNRRLSDKILQAFEQACAQKDLAAAEHLIRALEVALTKEGGPGRVDHRKELGPVFEAYERLKSLRHQG